MSSSYKHYNPIEDHDEHIDESNETHALFVKIVDHLRKSTGLPLPYFDRNSRICMVTETEIVINLIKEENKQRISLYAPILASTPIEIDEALMTWLLEANLLWQGTQGATLGILRHTNQIILSEIVHATENTLHLFDEQLVNFIDKTQNIELGLAKQIDDKRNRENSEELDPEIILTTKQNNILNNTHNPHTHNPHIFKA